MIRQRKILGEGENANEKQGSVVKPKTIVQHIQTISDASKEIAKKLDLLKI